MTAVATITDPQRRARFARRHRLTLDGRTDDVVAIADAVVALHSSDPCTVYLSAMARMANPSLAAVDSALYEDRSLLRFHAMRRTLWVATPEVARAAHASSTLKFLAPERRRFVKLLVANGIAEDLAAGEEWIDRAEAETVEALEELEVATTRQLGEKVPALRQPIDVAPGKSYSTTQSAHARLLLQMGFGGSIVRTRPAGGWMGSHYHWAPTQDWVPGGITGMDPAKASVEMVRRWLLAFGPGTTTDVQWWMGWNGRDTKAALAGAGAQEVELGGVPGWVAPGDAEADLDEPEPWVALLPGLDPTSMGWKARAWYIEPDVVEEVFDRNGNCGPTIWVDGHIVGGWAQRREGAIALRVLTDIGRERVEAVEAAAGALESLLGADRVATRFPGRMQEELLA